jgi:hypothetical protein
MLQLRKHGKMKRSHVPHVGMFWLQELIQDLQIFDVQIVSMNLLFQRKSSRLKLIALLATGVYEFLSVQVRGSYDVLHVWKDSK